MIKNILLIYGLLMLHKAEAQIKGGAEQYFSFSHSVPVHSSVTMNFQSHSGIYTEARFQYDMDGSVSLNVGKSFSYKKSVSYSLRPTLGVMAGTYKGINLNLDADTEWKSLFLSMKSQYTHSTSNNFNSFFYSWLEAGYEFSKNIYAGISSQLLLPGQSCHTINTGFFIGFTAGNWSLPVYFFDSFKQSSSIQVGVIFNKQFF